MPCGSCLAVRIVRSGCLLVYHLCTGISLPDSPLLSCRNVVIRFLTLLQILSDAVYDYGGFICESLTSLQTLNSYIYFEIYGFICVQYQFQFSVLSFHFTKQHIASFYNIASNIHANLCVYTIVL
ncbi:hypothetical protein GYMLUDRAFT_494826 [Collybiopsis luxurians FD-317 M1]|uniref:Uncharacterized protein n=1 Tax=Collybiopsis luxurians FD-317 M1 TaxID=944289 RepID=A0A0D0C5W0_9AGAR|nr:hypothetical protein GYMLUDRAFT_494826 [Collybiopsis luxurians FD-317 M1]